MFKVENVIRKHLLDLEPYASARDEFQGDAKIFLDANENALGSVSELTLNRYPDPHQRETKSIIAQQKAISEDQIFLGNGSDEGIDLLIRAFCEPGKDQILLTPPTYGMYKVSANIHNVGIQNVSLTEDFMLDENRLFDSINDETKLIFLCNPNNPTGNLLQEDVMLKLVEAFAGIVVIDEAYIDFSPTESMIRFIETYPNLVILQTFSKAWGLAALRLGMAFAHADIIKVLNNIKPPYNINQLTQDEAIKSLHQLSKKNEFVDHIIKAKTELIQQLKETKGILNVFPSATNFVLVKVNEPNKLYRQLIDEEIVVRNRSNVQLCSGCLRITVGTSQENNSLIQKIRTFNLNY